jgi:hypothetical protein
MVDHRDERNQSCAEIPGGDRREFIPEDRFVVPASSFLVHFDFVRVDSRVEFARSQFRTRLRRRSPLGTVGVASGNVLDARR